MTLRKRDRVVLAVVAVAALLGVFYMLGLKPERQKASSLASQIAAQRQAIVSAQASYNAGRAAQAALKTDGEEWAALKLAVPEQSVHVAMKSLTLSGSSSSSGAAAATTVTGTTGATPAATPVPIQLTFSGGYIALNKLVSRLTGLVTMTGGDVHATGPLLSINSVNLSGASKLTGSVTATIYQLAAPAGATTGGQG